MAWPLAICFLEMPGPGFWRFRQAPNTILINNGESLQNESPPILGCSHYPLTSQFQVTILTSWPVHETRAVLTATGASSSHEVCLVRNGPSRCYHLAGFTIELRMTYGWWFRNPARKPVEVGSLSLYWQGVLHLSFRWLALGFLNHQQYVQDHLNNFKSAKSMGFCWLNHSY